MSSATMATLHRVLLAAVAGGSFLGGCDLQDPGSGSLRIGVFGESYVEDHIPAADLVDGWNVEFTKFLVAVSDIEADGVELEGEFVFDLRANSSGLGHEIGALTVPAGQDHDLAYRIAPARAPRGGNTDDGDRDAMIDLGYSLWVQGAATKDGQTVTFDWGFETDTRYVDCVVAQRVEASGQGEAQITVHADHLFYDDLDSEEPNVAFDLIASADENGDAQVTREELAAVDITGLDRYQVGSRDIEELWSFIAEQTTTVGHIDGEGHCEREP